MKLATRLAVALLLAGATLFLGDYALLSWRISRNQGYGSIQVSVVYQIPQKGNKAEYVAVDPQMQTCVRSLFPHLGDQPCWYLRRHTQQQISY